MPVYPGTPDDFMAEVRRHRGSGPFFERSQYMLSRPIHDRVLIRLHKAADMAAGGLLHIPEEAKEIPSRGEVVAVGEGRILENGTKIPLDIKQGDIVLFGRYSGTDVTVLGEKLKLVREDECLMVLAPGEYEA